MRTNNLQNKINKVLNLKSLILKSFAIVMLFTISLSSISPAFAAVPQSMSYSAVLRDAAGVPLAGTYDFKVRYYDASISGVLMYEESFVSTTINTGGTFFLPLGTGSVISGTFASINFNTPIFITLNTKLTSAASYDGEMNPRIPLRSVPFALNSEKLDGRVVGGANGIVAYDASSTINTNGLNASGSVNILNNLNVNATSTLSSVVSNLVSSLIGIFNKLFLDPVATGLATDTLLVRDGVTGEVKGLTAIGLLASSTTNNLSYSTSTNLLTSDVNGVISNVSLPPSENFFNTDLVATADRFHSFNNFGLFMGGLTNFEVASQFSGKLSAGGFGSAAEINYGSGAISLLTGDIVQGANNNITIGTPGLEFTSSNNLFGYDSSLSLLNGEFNYRNNLTGLDVIKANPNGNLAFGRYPNNRDDSLSLGNTPTNFLYTNNSGELLSAPMSSLGITSSTTNNLSFSTTTGIFSSNVNGILATTSIAMSSDNFANANLTATADRQHNFSNFNLEINNINAFNTVANSSNQNYTNSYNLNSQNLTFVSGGPTQFSSAGIIDFGTADSTYFSSANKNIFTAGINNVFTGVTDTQLGPSSGYGALFRNNGTQKQQFLELQQTGVANSFGILAGNSNPEGLYAAQLGSIYLNKSGLTGKAYLKTSNNAANTGWSEILTGSGLSTTTTSNLQQVTDNGATTTNSIVVRDLLGRFTKQGSGSFTFASLVNNNSTTLTFSSPANTNNTVALPGINSGVLALSVNGLTADAVGDIDITPLLTSFASPITVQNTTSLFATGLPNPAGVGATGAGNSIFLGSDAGFNAINASESNFFGNGAGINAANASFSNFYGTDAGSGATDSSQSNFFGRAAGLNATNANNSNFFGAFAGQAATDALGSNFFGAFAGQGATNAASSNFFAPFAGQGATNANSSNFFGNQAGNGAVNASSSNFFGEGSGSAAINAANSNFFGTRSGFQANNAANSIFIGENAGLSDNVNNVFSGTSILIGRNTNTGGFSDSIALGEGAVNTKTNQLYIRDAITNFNLAGVNYTFPNAQGGAGTTLSNDGSGVLSWTTGGSGATTTVTTNLLSFSTTTSVLSSNVNGALSTTSLSVIISPITLQNGNSLFSTGLTNTGGGSAAINANFFGEIAGQGAVNANNSNFLGRAAGESAVNAFSSNFLGRNAGVNAAFANTSNFLGQDAGANARNAFSSNFLGQLSGDDATNANNSNFLGLAAGRSATNARNSNFFGLSAGQNAANANNSIFIGNSSGANDTVNNLTGGTSILIGDNTNTGGFSNSIALGANAINTKTNQFLVGPNYTDFNFRGVNYTFPSSQATTSGQILTNDGSGLLSWSPVSGGNISSSTIAANLGFVNGGNSFGGVTTIGTNDNNNLNFEVNNNSLLTLTPKGRLLQTNSLNNSFIGVNTGNETTTGTNNIGNGFTTLTSLTTGNKNLALGFESMVFNTTGSENVALGANALRQNSTGFANIAIGTNALLQSNSALNVAIGYQSMSGNISGANNTAAGYQALTQTTTGSSNAAFGDRALYQNTTGDFNAAMGYLALPQLTSGNQNVGIGMFAGTSLVTGSQNIAIGQGTVLKNNTSNQLNIGNIIYGTGLGNYNFTSLNGPGLIGIGTSNPGNKLEIDATVGGSSGLRFTRLNSTSATTTANGKVLSLNALGDVILTDAGTASGSWSLFGNTGTNPNTNFIGTTDANSLQFKVNNILAGSIQNISKNIFFGENSGNAIASSTVNTANIGIGYQSMGTTTTNFGSNNIGLGYQTLFNMVNGNNNNAIGYQSMLKSNFATNNVANGGFTLTNNVNGNNNVAIGHQSMANNISGSANTAGGYQSLFNSTGNQNTAYGFLSMFNNTSGNANSAFGRQALAGNTTGGNNTGVGYQAGLTQTSGDNNIFIGQGTSVASTTGSAQLSIGNLIYGTGLGTILGKIGIGTNTPNNKLEITSDTVSNSGLRFTNLTQSSATSTSNGKALTVNALGDVVLVDNLGVTTINSLTFSTTTSELSSIVNGVTATTSLLNIISNAWNVNGNIGTNPLTDFVGTRDLTDLVFKTNATETMRIGATGTLSVLGLIDTIGAGVNLTLRPKAKITPGGFGGLALLQGGNSGAVGTGGLARLIGGNGGTTSGNGGNVNLLGGTATEGNGGSVSLSGVNGSSLTGTARNGGQVSLAGGSPAFGGVAGRISISGGPGSLSDGGIVQIFGGLASAGFVGGNTSLRSGGSFDGNAGNLVLGGAAGTGTTGNGGNVIIGGGSVTSGGITGATIFASAIQSDTVFTERMRLASNGNFGIGTTTPTETLSLLGNFRLDGAFMPGNNAGATGTVLISQGLGMAPIWVATSSLGISGSVSVPTTNLLSFSTSTGLLSSNVNGVLATSSLSAIIPLITRPFSGSLFSTGLPNTGVGSIAIRSNFFGEGAGFGGVNANESNFFGPDAGNGATNASQSNFFGKSAGFNAVRAQRSNFFGISAGSAATNANSSNFFGSGAGSSATNANSSNFFGQAAGQGATDAKNSNFFGTSAGFSALNSEGSNFFGLNAGSGATDAPNSNFFGSDAGSGATNAFKSNFFGLRSGENAANAANSIFIGQSAGQSDTVNNVATGTSILIGNFTNTGGFSNSIALGEGVINTATNQLYIRNAITNFNLAGVNYTFPTIQGATGTALTNNGSGVLSWAAAGGSGPITVQNGTSLFSTGLLGTGLGSTVQRSIFLGQDAGNGATFAPDSNFFGFAAGQNATRARSSNFFGNSAGQNAINASESNFFGAAAGANSINADGSNFFGNNAGLAATNANNSNFFGNSAGFSAINANNSNFFGVNAGANATDAYSSNFFGDNAGVGATNADNSLFFGKLAGANAVTARNSIFLGQASGNSDTVNNGAADSSILIGDFTNTGGFSNSIALGANAINTKTNQFLVGPNYTDFNFRGVNYTFPSAQAIATGQVLTNDGLGGLSWGSVSGGGPDTNFATTDLTATGNRLHNFANNSLTLNNVSLFQLASFGGHNLSAGGLVDYVSGTGFRFLSPLARIESLTPNTSGLRLVNLTSSSPVSTSTTQSLGVDSLGNVVTIANGSIISSSTIASNLGFIQNGNSFGTLATLGTNDANDLALKTNNLERMRIDTNGNVRIGNNGLISKLSVDGGISTILAGPTNPNGIKVGTDGVDPTWNYDYTTDAGTFRNNYYGITWVPTTFGATTNFSGYTGLNLQTNGFDRLSISQFGNVGIGTNAPTQRLQVGDSSNTGNLLVFGTGTTCSIGNGTGATLCSSDERLKNNISTSTSNLEKLLSLRPVEYKWNDNLNRGSSTQLGLIAQEVEKVFPGYVSEVYDGMKGVDYAALVTPLIGSVQELNTKLAALEMRTNASSTNSGVGSYADMINTLTTKLNDGTLDIIVNNIKANKVETKELCLEDVCISKAQFIQMLQSSGVTQNSDSNNSGNNGNIIIPPVSSTTQTLTCTLPQVTNPEGTECITPAPTNALPPADPVVDPNASSTTP